MSNNRKSKDAEDILSEFDSRNKSEPEPEPTPEPEPEPEPEPTPEPEADSISDDPFYGISDDEIAKYSDWFDIPPPENDADAIKLGNKIRTWIKDGKPKPGDSKINSVDDEADKEDEEEDDDENDSNNEQKSDYSDNKKDKTKKKRGLFGLFKK